MFVQCGKTYLVFINYLTTFNLKHTHSATRTNTHTLLHTYKSISFSSKHTKQSHEVVLYTFELTWMTEGRHTVTVALCNVKSKHSHTRKNTRAATWLCRVWAAVGFGRHWQTTCLLWIWMKLCMSNSFWHDSFISKKSNTRQGIWTHELPSLTPCHFSCYAWLRQNVN